MGTLNLDNIFNLCQKMSSLTNQYINKLKPDTIIILLIGLTGAGKSTLFNYLCGAEFVSNGRELELKHPSDQFSRMQGGMISVTKEPKFYMNNNNNHLLIDFPGFQDTTGNCDQLLFDLLFNKIVSLGEMKILYIIKSPESTLPSRGSDLQGFIQQLDNPNFNLLLNCYTEDLEDQELINYIKQELSQANLQNCIDQIIVQRKARQGNLDKCFNNNHRQNFWNQIKEMNKVQIKPKNIPKSEIISDFLISLATKKIQENGNIMFNFFSQKADETNQQVNVQMLENLKLFKVLMQNDKHLTALQWFEDFINICESLTNFNNETPETTKNSQDFITIFQYFEQFKEFIQGFEQLETINKFAKQNFKQVEILVDTKIELIQQWKKEDEAKKKAEEEAKKAEEEKKKAEQVAKKAEQVAKKAEEEKTKAEQIAKKAEDEKKKAEIEKKKIEEEAKKVLKVKKKAEEEAKKAEEEKKKAEQMVKEEKKKAEEDEAKRAEIEKKKADEEIKKEGAKRKAEEEAKEAEQARIKIEKEAEEIAKKGQEEREKQERQFQAQLKEQLEYERMINQQEKEKFQRYLDKMRQQQLETQLREEERMQEYRKQREQEREKAQREQEQREKAQREQEQREYERKQEKKKQKQRKQELREQEQREQVQREYEQRKQKQTIQNEILKLQEAKQHYIKTKTGMLNAIFGGDPFGSSERIKDFDIQIQYLENKLYQL